MTARAVLRKQDRTTTYVCLMGHVNVLGEFPEGLRVRGDHPDVARLPLHWIDADASAEEIHAARIARFVAPLEK